MTDGLGGHWDYWGTGCAFHVLFFSDSLFVYPTGFFLVSTGILQGESGEGEILLTSNGFGFRMGKKNQRFNDIFYE